MHSDLEDMVSRIYLIDDRPTAMAGEILADCIISNKKIPAGFDSYGPTNTFGMAGLMGVQIAYWYFQIRDILKDRIKL